MDPGQFKHLVTIQAASGSPNSHGQTTRSWAAITDGANIWAKIEPASGREVIQAAQTQAIVTHKVTLRSYLAGVTSKQRVLYGSRIFYIESVRNPGEANETLELICREDV